MLRSLLKSMLIFIALSSFGQCGMTFTVSQDTLCAGSGTSISVSFQGTGTLNWFTTGIGSLTNNLGTNTTYYSNELDSGYVDIFCGVEDSNNVCYDSVKSVSIFVKSNAVIRLNTAPTASVCVSDSSIALNISTAGNPQWWDDGTGSYDNINSKTPIYTFSAADKTRGYVTLGVTSIGGNCADYDSVMVTFVSSNPTVNAGPDECSSDSIVALNGSGSNANSYQWISSGSGSFVNATSLNAQYLPSGLDRSNGGVMLSLYGYGCGNAFDTKVLSLSNQAYVNIGNDRPLNNYVSLNAAGAFSSLIWTTTGTGIFTTTTGTNTTYYPSHADTMAGQVFIIATATSPCGVDMDTVRLYRSCDLSIGANQSVCFSASEVTVFSNQNSIQTMQWYTSGSGSFQNDSSFVATYYPSASDRNSGSIMLYVIGQGAGCMATDTIMVSFDSTNISGSVPADMTICSNQAYVILNGATNAPVINWFSSGTGMFYDGNQAVTSYYISAADIANGSVYLGMEGSGACGHLYDSLLLIITPGPTIQVGPDQSLANGPINISASIVNAGGITWNTSGTGTFSSTTDTMAVYTPSAADLASGFVVLGAQTTMNGSCNPAYDSLLLIGNSPVCSLTTSISVSGNQATFAAESADSSYVGSYFWNFGDGNSAYGKFQQHTYASSGIYTVSCFFLTADSMCSATAYDSAMISVVTVATYNISGTIMAGANTADHAHVSLFSVDGTYFEYVGSDIVTPNDNGNYQFTNVPNGHYIVFAFMANQSAYQNYIACYFPNQSVWANATQIVVNNANQTGKNITMIPFTPPSNGWDQGADTIRGTIVFDVPLSARTLGSSDPVQFASVSLYDQSGNLLTTVNTDQYGNYSFDGIIAGNYTIKVEYPGGATSSASYSVTADGDANTISTAAIEVGRQQISVDVTDAINTEHVSLYPNPTQGVLHVQISNGAAEISIFNALGEEVLHKGVSTHEELSLSELNAGVYVIRVVQGEHVYQTRIVKY